MSEGHGIHALTGAKATQIERTAVSNRRLPFPYTRVVIERLHQDSLTTRQSPIF